MLFRLNRFINQLFFFSSKNLRSFLKIYNFVVWLKTFWKCCWWRGWKSDDHDAGDNDDDDNTNINGGDNDDNIDKYTAWNLLSIRCKLLNIVFTIWKHWNHDQNILYVMRRWSTSMLVTRFGYFKEYMNNRSSFFFFKKTNK